MPIALTDQQLEHVTAAARHIPPFQRSRFLRRIAVLLRGRNFDDGDVHRACRTAAAEMQRSQAGRIIAAVH